MNLNFKLPLGIISKGKTKWCEKNIEIMMMISYLIPKVDGLPQLL